MALGLVAISGILLLLRTSIFSTLLALMFLAGLSPVLPFAPPGLALFFLYHRLWRRALSSRVSRDLLRLRLRGPEGAGAGASAVEGDPEARARGAERDAFLYASAAGIALGLAVIVNFALAFLIWRAAL